MNNAYFDQLACKWDEKQDVNIVAKIDDIFNELHSELAYPILDIGSGTGVLIPSIRKYADDYIIELDISKKMLETASAKFPEIQKCDFIQADAHRLPFNRNCFGTVICFCVFPHFEYPQRAVSEIYRALRPGGYLIILHLMDHQQLNAMHASLNEDLSADVLPSSADLSFTLEKQDFVIQKCEENPGLYLIIARKANG